MASRNNHVLTIGAVALAFALIGLTGYVFYLATRPTPGGSGVASNASLEVLEVRIRNLLAKGNWADASVVLEDAVKQFPGDLDIRQRLAEVYQQLATTARDNGDEAESRRLFAQSYEQWAKIIELGADDAAAYFRAAMAANAAKLPEARELFERAALLDPNKPEYVLNLGLVQYNAGEYDIAQISLLRATRLKPDMAPAWAMLAQTYLREGSRNVALTQIARAREIDPVDPNWRIIEADIVAVTDADRAIALLETLDERMRRRADVLRIARNAYGAKGRFRDAAAFYVMASDHDPTDADVALGAADLLDRAGQRERAIEYARRAEEAGHTGAKKMLDRLMAGADGGR